MLMSKRAQQILVFSSSHNKKQTFSNIVYILCIKSYIIFSLSPPCPVITDDLFHVFSKVSRILQGPTDGFGQVEGMVCEENYTLDDNR